MAVRRSMSILAACVVALAELNAAAWAAPRTVPVGENLRTSQVATADDSAAVDPVIEEPLRPLLPAGQSLPLEGPGQCGGITPLAVLVALALISTVRLVSFRRTEKLARFESSRAPR